MLGVYFLFMLEALLSSAEHPPSLGSSGLTSNNSFSSVFQQYLSLDPLLIGGTALAFYVGYARRNLLDLALPFVVVSIDNVFRKVTDIEYTFEHFGGDVKIEALFVLGAYLLGLLGGCAKKAYFPRRHHSPPS